MSRPQPDLSTYVAIGDSITTGYMDGALLYKGQLCAYSNLLAAQFAAYNMKEFRQPLVDKQSDGIGFSGNSRIIVKKEAGSLFLSYLHPCGDQSIFNTPCFTTQGPFHNMGVPGLKSFTALMKGYGNPANGPGNFNPFFTRMASDPQQASVLEDALAMHHSFFSLFIGNNDVLAYALSGGTEDAITPTYSKDAELSFETCIRILVGKLTENGAKGVICGIPDISGIPFFTTIPYNGLLLNAAAAEELNKLYKQNDLQFAAGLNAFPVKDIMGTRLAKEGELILQDVLLDPQASDYLSGKLPLPKKYTLSLNERMAVKKATAEYNELLQAIAEEKKLAFVNTNALIRQLKPDREYDPVSHGLHFRKNHVFSLDGIHLSPLGQALLANEFIKAINRTYSAFIPRISLSRYRKMSYIHMHALI